MPLGQLELDQGRLRQALKPLERAPSLRQKDAIRRRCWPDVELALARALGRDHKRACALADKARDQRGAYGSASRTSCRMFDRFVSGRRREGGLGLGLYLAKRIAVLHGGDLTFESPPGKGARFVLVLPMYAGNLD